MRSRFFFFVILGLLLMCLSPAGARGDSVVPSFVPQGGSASQQSAVLYFRYGAEPYLGRENRTVFFNPGTAFEKALLQSLLEGPGSVYPHLEPMFPLGTEILATHAQGDMLFVTFNERLLDAYPDEKSLSSAAYREKEGRLKRELAMAALSCTITENTPYAYVQVLVLGKTRATTSMRLSERYYLKDSDALPPPLSRAEHRILTPQSAAALLCDYWLGLDLSSMAGLLVSAGQATDLPERIPLLTHYTLSSGTVSPDRQNAIVLADFTLQSPDGNTHERIGWPLRLRYMQGIWLIESESLQTLWGAAQ